MEFDSDFIQHTIDRVSNLFKDTENMEYFLHIGKQLLQSNDLKTKAVGFWVLAKVSFVTLTPIALDIYGTGVFIESNYIQLCLDSIRCDPMFSWAYYTLAIILDHIGKREKIYVPHTMKFLDVGSLLIEAINLNSMHVPSYNKLSIYMRQTKIHTVELKTGRKTHHDLLIESLKLNPTRAKTYIIIAIIIGKYGHFKLPDGRILMKSEMIREALKYNIKPENFYFVAPVLSDTEIVHVNGKYMNKSQLYRGFKNPYVHGKI